MTNPVDQAGHRHDAPDHVSRAAGPIAVLRLDTARRADGTFDGAFLSGLRTALHEIGFLQLTGYGAAPGQIGELTAAAARFFALPLADRLRLDNRRSPHFRVIPGSGTRSPPGGPTPASRSTSRPTRLPSPASRGTLPTGCSKALTSGPMTPSPSS
jgi:isopenicillin N synthase-like dioxygenase